MKVETFKYSIKNGWSDDSFRVSDSEQTFVLVFAAPEMNKDLAALQKLKAHYPQSHIIGCSGAGEILGCDLSDNSMSVAVVQFDKTSLKLARHKVQEGSNSSYEAGKSIIEQLKSDDLRGILVLSDGLNINGSELARGLNTINNDRIIITGGLAGDGDRFKETWTIYNGEICYNYVVAIGFYGDAIQMGYSSKGGWDFFGPERVITKSMNNILYELDGKPALDLYKEYLGERANELPSSGLLYPLTIRKDAKDQNSLVRTILGIDEEKQALIFAGEVPTGSLAQLMRANFDRLIEKAGEAGIDAISKMGIGQNGSILSVAISCVGRRLILGERTEEEIEAALEGMPKSTRQLGFYSYGELSPFTAGTCDLHNQTMTLTTFSEKT